MKNVEPLVTKESTETAANAMDNTITPAAVEMTTFENYWVTDTG
jgi:hypothetical protein